MTIDSNKKKIIVAIDGPSGSGKSTVAQNLALSIGYNVLDTGALYRSIALQAVRCGVSWDNAVELEKISQKLSVTFKTYRHGTKVYMNGEDVSALLRNPHIADGASRLSTFSIVRSALLDLQRQMGERGGIIAEGRDIASVVFPQAPVKIFLTASLAKRAGRRHAEFKTKGIVLPLEQITEQISVRDQRDRNREIAPLLCTEDAETIDSSFLSVDEIVAQIKCLILVAEKQ